MSAISLVRQFNRRFILAFRLLPAAILAASIAACSGGGGGNATEAIQTDPPKAAGMLSQAADSTALEQSIKRGLKQSYDVNNAPLGLDIASAERGDPTTLAAPQVDASADAGGGSGGFTTTYTLESGVGEADIVKYDGDLMYALQQPRYCPECVDGQTVPAQRQIRIMRTNPDDATASEVGTIPLGDHSADGQYLQVQGMYLPKAGQLVVMQTSGFFGTCGVGWTEPGNWAQQITRVTFFDTSDPASPRADHEIELDGAYTASRRVDGRLYLVSRFTPSTPFPQPFYAADGSELDTASSNLDDVALTELLPKQRQSNAEESALFEATDCYVPTNNEETPDSPSLTTVSVIPFDQPENMKSTCYTGEAYGMYMSTESLYLSSQRYEYTDTSSADFTVLHKFDLDGVNVNYRGSAEIPGTLGHGEQLDFRMSEHDGLLRVATSEYDFSQQPTDLFTNEEPDAGADNIDHRITVLRESTTAEELEIVATLPNDSRPDEIGKPNERLYGVRFFGDRAYLVTFEVIDPLYVIDLSNPEDPLIAGALELPGVADFLHPVSDDLLLTIGRDANDSGAGFALLSGVKVELINVADISAPYSLNNLVIGSRGSFSEAIYDRHAFTYLAVDAATAHFAIPIDVYEAAEDSRFHGDWSASGLHLFELDNIDDPQNASLAASGVIVAEQNNGQQFAYPRYSGQRRSIFHDDSVFMIGNGLVWSSFWEDPDSVNILGN